MGVGMGGDGRVRLGSGVGWWVGDGFGGWVEWCDWVAGLCWQGRSETHDGERKRAKRAKRCSWCSACSGRSDSGACACPTSTRFGHTTSTKPSADVSRYHDRTAGRGATTPPLQSPHHPRAPSSSAAPPMRTSPPPPPAASPSPTSPLPTPPPSSPCICNGNDELTEPSALSSNAKEIA